jgi:hypothetical protein
MIGYIQEVFGTIKFKILCQRSEMWNFLYILFVCVWGRKFISHCWKNMQWGCWGEYFNFGWGQVTGSLMKMCTEDFHALHIVPHCIRMRISFMSHVARMGKLGKVHKVLVGRYEDKIKMKLNHLGRRLWTGLSCFKIKTSVTSLCHHQWSIHVVSRYLPVMRQA